MIGSSSWNVSSPSAGSRLDVALDSGIALLGVTATFQAFHRPAETAHARRILAPPHMGSVAW